MTLQKLVFALSQCVIDLLLGVLNQILLNLKAFCFAVIHCIGIYWNVLLFQSGAFDDGGAASVLICPGEDNMGSNP